VKKSLNKWLHSGRTTVTKEGWLLGDFWLEIETTDASAACGGHATRWEWRLRPATPPNGRWTMSGECHSRSQARAAVIAAWREASGMPPQNLPAGWAPKAVKRWNRRVGSWNFQWEPETGKFTKAHYFKARIPIDTPLDEIGALLAKQGGTP
jgi:hypothetical protein